jgi:hypothetical protein
MTFDAASGRLYVAGIDPKALGGRGNDKPSGGIYVFSLKDVGAK